MRRPSRAALGGTAVALLAGAAVAWGLLTTRSGPGSAAPADTSAMAGLPPEARTPAARRGEASSSAWLEIPAPVVPFRSLGGDTVSLADYRGRVVVLNFWGTWCPPCRREIPGLVALQRRIAGHGATVVGLAIDSGTPASVRAWTRAHGMTYPIWLGDTGTAVRYYQTMGFPTTLLVDAGGVIRRRYLGPQTEEHLLGDLRRLGVDVPEAAASGPGAAAESPAGDQPPSSSPR
ncbi:MAG: TlpA disulfide reductase family protein [Candidatus Palauibacterales bacterium]|nr:TlpA disulfide reductase family protein [Candidatus Palauibacterales bacterium]MDP2528970.1 TlpA disulfide reductase family protein [Candidatus Palauibacterales bacterium]MDP2583788.1 TlpA disulfide reductase family protein [Candidatus Palauibacterales bacterium]